jgi:allophanate hydrolase subunit 1
LTFEKFLKEKNPSWLIDTTALRTTIMLTFDPLLIKTDEVIDDVRNIISQGITVPDNYPSRVIHLPVYYNDPITIKCAESFGMGPNLEILARENGITIAEIIERHTSPEYFVSYTSFMFGSIGAFPIGNFTPIKNSKYKTPRTWTPPGALGIGGSTTTLYSIKSPGGLMMLGIVPVKTFDLEKKNIHFKKDPLLAHPGDRLKFTMINNEEYLDITNSIDKYIYNIENGYIDWKKYEGS